SWLAGDAGNSVFQTRRGDAIAGKPAPTLTVPAFAVAVAFDLQHSAGRKADLSVKSQSKA
ncbi:hypothetical protein QN410_31875, partial [Pseudomonas sp. Bout1]|nr:hypothetical protein [Pseudomonas sp. Bout1]